MPVHVHPIGAITKNQEGRVITEMGEMIKAGAVAFSDDGIPVSNGQVFRLACEYASMFGVPTINHAEDPCIRRDGVMHEGAVSAELGFTGNPDIAESSMVNRDLEISQLTGVHLHVPHVSALKSIEHIRKRLELNQNITAEVTPHHLYFNHAWMVFLGINSSINSLYVILPLWLRSNLSYRKFSSIAVG